MALLIITDDPGLDLCDDDFCSYCGEPLNPEGYWSNDHEARWVAAGGLGRAWCADLCAENHEPPA